MEDVAGKADLPWMLGDERKISARNKEAKVRDGFFIKTDVHHKHRIMLIQDCFWLQHTCKVCLTLLLLCSPAISLGFTILGENFACVTTIEVVTFRLREW